MIGICDKHKKAACHRATSFFSGTVAGLKKSLIAMGRRRKVASLKVQK